ncbi:MAG: GWxTD domain-containing protein [Candidatus Marinimicrobia bacterium]|nr:GWxTD domain-containing protein [Candidatus Neomarinimicrobiota bacterium]
MRNTTFTLFLLILCFLAGDLSAQRERNSGSKSAAIHQFKLSAFAEMVDSDSVRIVGRIDVPYRALQFLKTGYNFSAGFEANISLTNKDGKQIGKQSWKKNIVADNYIESTSGGIAHYLTAQFVIAKGTYTMTGILMDNDTRKSGVKKESIDLQKLNDAVFLLPPVLLEEKSGEWGFGKNQFPISGSQLDVGNNSLSIILSGKVKPGAFKLQSAVTENKKSDDWTFSADYDSETGIFSEEINLLRSELNSIKMFVAAKLSQGKQSSLQTKQIIMKRPGLSRSITNVEEAIEQMRYILESEERKQLNDSNRREREQLFLVFWANRDPTPGTSKNELMDEYYMRVAYAKQNFESFQPGWKTDMGMIYILFGPPNEVDRYDRPSQGYSRRTWHFYRINRSFVFEDDTGFGDYRLTTPFMRHY